MSATARFRQRRTGVTSGIYGNPHFAIDQILFPRLKELGLTTVKIDLITKVNPIKAYALKNNLR
ncbi:MAG: hypothetical protein AAFX53_17885 [Bacteroidota bacterium]